MQAPVAPTNHQYLISRLPVYVLTWPGDDLTRPINCMVSRSKIFAEMAELLHRNIQPICRHGETAQTTPKGRRVKCPGKITTT